MKRLIILLLIVTAAAAGGGWYTGHLAPSGSATAANGLLAYVPADTAYYLGQSGGVTTERHAAQWQALIPARSASELPSPQQAAARGGPAVGMIIALDSLQREAARTGHVYSALGLAPNGTGALYDADGLPVLRQRLEDADTFWQTVDKAEARAAVTPVDSTTDTTRHYPFKATGDDTPPELVIAERDGYAVVTLAVPGLESALPLALGERLPERGLGASERLSELADEHGTLAAATGFIEHERIAAAFTGGADSTGGLRELVRSLSATYDWQLPTASAGCAADLTALTKLWPRSVLGLTHADAASGRIDARWVMTISDPRLIQTLRQLRGHIPETGTDGVASVGMGISMANLMPAVRTLVGNISSAQFQCPHLIRLQQQVTAGDLSALSMASGVLGSVRGLRLSLTQRPRGAVDNPTGVIVIATDQPETLWRMAQGFLGSEATPQVGGPAVPLHHPGLDGDTDVRIALRSDRILLLADPRVEPPESPPSNLDANGVFGLRYNPAHASTGVLEALDVLPVPPGQPDAAALEQRLARMDVDTAIHVDFSQQGIQLDVSLTPAAGD